MRLLLAAALHPHLDEVLVEAVAQRAEGDVAGRGLARVGADVDGVQPVRGLDGVHLLYHSLRLAAVAGVARRLGQVAELHLRYREWQGKWLAGWMDK